MEVLVPDLPAAHANWSLRLISVAYRVKTRINKALSEGEGTKDLGVQLFNHGINGGGAMQIRDGCVPSGGNN